MVNEENSRKGNVKMSLELEKSENGRKVIEFINRKKVNSYSTSREYTVLAEMRNFISKVDKPFESVTEQDIINYCATLTGKESTKTTKKIVLKAFFSSIGKLDIVSFISGKMTPCDIKPDDLLTDDEIKRMIELAQQVKYKAIISLLYESNARIGEILNLRIKDLEFEKDCARITVKNEKNLGTRTIVLFDSRFYIEKYLKEEHTDPTNRESYLFHMKHPIDLFKKLSADSINDTLQMIGRQANIDKHIHCHLFRHTGTTRDMKKRGYNEAHIRFKNGWSASSKMPSRYIHLCNSDTEDLERQIRGIENKVELVVPRICEKCNFSNSYNLNYCGNCGYPISGESKQKLTEISKMLWDCRGIGLDVENNLKETVSMVKSLRNNNNCK